MTATFRLLPSAVHPTNDKHGCPTRAHTRTNGTHYHDAEAHVDMFVKEEQPGEENNRMESMAATKEWKKGSAKKMRERKAR